MALPVLIVIVGVELALGANLAFSYAFDALAAEYYQPVINQDVMLGVLFVGVLVHFIAAFALLRLKMWARSIFVFAPLVLALLEVATLGMPTYSSPILNMFIMIDTALYGAIALLCYGRDQGGTWFSNAESLGR